ncbi:MAG: TolC family protein [Sedimentisphaerales bacterium]|nr:TolC family protein [Sedimentisphaerales bacterium]
MNNRVSISICAVAAAVVVLSGCSSFDGQQVRREHAESYRQYLDQKAEEMLPVDKPLTLKDCLRIALKNNLDIRVAEVQQRVAELSRKASFSQFLPRVNFNYGYTRWDPQPEVVMSGTSRPMHDERIREMTWDIQMSIFNPSTWFMYGLHERGEEIAELAADYTRQMIVIQVTTYYYYCLGLEEIEKVLDSRIRAAEKLAEQLQHFQTEGLVFPWQSDQARTNLESQRLQKQRVRHLLEETKGQLLIAMGLSPLDSLQLDAAEPVILLEGSLEDFITKALLNHPRLRVSDRQVAIEEEKVKLALSSFLPSLTGFADRVNTTDAFQRYSSYWIMGLSGVLTVFNGFENIHEYDAAKENVKKATLEREQATLILMLEVFRAYQNLQLAQTAAGVAVNNYNAARGHYDQVYQQWQEGLVDVSDLLSVVAERDLAQMVIINSQFQVQVSIATLLNTIGQTETQYEEAQHDGQS